MAADVPQAPAPAQPAPDRVDAPEAASGSLRLDVVTIFPDYLRVLELSLIGKAAGTGLIDLAVHDLRGWAHDRHRTVDDTPLGGGAGMVMRPDVWGEALDTVQSRLDFTTSALFFIRHLIQKAKDFSDCLIEIWRDFLV